MNACEHLMGRDGEEGASLRSVVPSDRTRNNRHKLNHMKFCPEKTREKKEKTQLFYIFTGQLLAQAAQNGCRCSILGGYSNLTAHNRGNLV